VNEISWDRAIDKSNGHLMLPAEEQCRIVGAASPLKDDAVATASGDVPARIPQPVIIDSWPVELRALEFELAGDLHLQLPDGNHDVEIRVHSPGLSGWFAATGGRIRSLIAVDSSRRSLFERRVFPRTWKGRTDLMVRTKWRAALRTIAKVLRSRSVDRSSMFSLRTSEIGNPLCARSVIKAPSRTSPRPPWTEGADFVAVEPEGANFVVDFRTSRGDGAINARADPERQLAGLTR